MSKKRSVAGLKTGPVAAGPECFRGYRSMSSNTLTRQNGTEQPDQPSPDVLGTIIWDEMQFHELPHWHEYTEAKWAIQDTIERVTEAELA